MKRSNTLELRLSDEEHDMLTALCETKGLAYSDCLRQLLRRHHDAWFGEPIPFAWTKKSGTWVRE